MHQDGLTILADLNFHYPENIMTVDDHLYNSYDRLGGEIPDWLSDLTTIDVYAFVKVEITDVTAAAAL